MHACSRVVSSSVYILDNHDAHAHVRCCVLACSPYFCAADQELVHVQLSLAYEYANCALWSMDPFIPILNFLLIVCVGSRPASIMQGFKSSGLHAGSTMQAVHNS
jgi:hypothetical protein